MTENHDHLDRDLERIAARLESERPVPAAAFRGELRRRLQERSRRIPAAPRRLRLAITAYAGSGLILLAIAAIGVAGAGPLAP
jgi:hypothetical protein